MGEVNEDATASKPVEDVTAITVDPDRGERLYKSATIQTKQGTTYRMVAKSLSSGKLDIVHYACTLLPDGTPEGKYRVNRILAVAPERFDTEIEFIKKSLKGDGEEVQGMWVHEMTGMPDLIAQSNSLEDWTRKMAAEIKKKPA